MFCNKDYEPLAETRKLSSINHHHSSERPEQPRLTLHLPYSLACLPRDIEDNSKLIMPKISESRLLNYRENSFPIWVPFLWSKSIDERWWKVSNIGLQCIATCNWGLGYTFYRLIINLITLHWRETELRALHERISWCIFALRRKCDFWNTL